MVERIESVDGRATGVTYWNERDERVTAKASVIVVAGGAIESARLLLNSGLGDGPLGRNLQGHYYPGADAIFADVMWDGVGPGATTATCRWNHGNDGIIGGGMLADDFIPLPINVWKGMTRPGLPRWGHAPKRWMRENYRYISDVRGPVQEIPSPTSRVSVDSNVRDRYGIPVARLSGATHPETVRTAKFMTERAREWVRHRLGQR